MHHSKQRRSAGAAAWTAAACAIALAFSAPSRVASAEPPPPRDWDLSMHLYGWIPSAELDISGDFRGDDFDRSFDKDLGDAFGDIDGGGGGDLHFRWKRLVGLIDGAWVQSDLSGGDGWFTNSIVDGKIGFRVLDIQRPMSEATGTNPAPRFTLDILGGARYRKAEIDVDVNTRFGEIDRDRDRDWVDAVVGLGLSVGILPNLTLSTVADYGGFDWGNSSHRTWSVNPRLTFRAWEHLDFFVGWKYLNEDHDSRTDLVLSGPQAGIGYAF
jgi:hypothetical protein